MRYSLKISLAFLLVFLVTSFAITNSAVDRVSTNRSVSLPNKQRHQVIGSLPSIKDFHKRPSDRFLVDLEVVRRGHPYKGRRAERPHTGGHVYFDVQDISGSTKTIQKSPAIYAVADGIITRIDYSFRLREMFEPALGKNVANSRYGIGLTFAREGNTGVTFHYSIEPFIDPGTDNFYDQFILVKLGQRVKKGQVIARMYIPENQKLAEKTHIHFNLIREGGGGFISPSIFDQKIVREFYRRWNLFPNDPDAPIPSCMGYMLEADENPFERKVVDGL
tara:strand:+ start:1009 stop:1839 length:831 start_codon:yes stop_codon:yes gene_type:complete